MWVTLSISLSLSLSSIAPPLSRPLSDHAAPPGLVQGYVWCHVGSLDPTRSRPAESQLWIWKNISQIWISGAHSLLHPHAPTVDHHRSPPHRHADTLTVTVNHTHTLTHTHSHSLILTHSHSHSLTHTRTHSLSHTLSLTHTLHTLTHSHSHSHSHLHTHTHTLSLSPSHTHTHSLTHPSFPTPITSSSLSGRSVPAVQRPHTTANNVEFLQRDGRCDRGGGPRTTIFREIFF